jgi:hypothetical protein
MKTFLLKFPFPPNPLSGSAYKLSWKSEATVVTGPWPYAVVKILARTSTACSPHKKERKFRKMLKIISKYETENSL